jgi:hypothetical protein
MHPIIFDLRPGDKGVAVANLQDALHTLPVLAFILPDNPIANRRVIPLFLVPIRRK